MFGLGFLKADPTTHVIHLSGGKRRRSGRGLAFWYWQPSSVLVSVPTASREEGMVIEERTSDHQAVVLSAALTFRVVDAERLAEQLNYAMGPRGQHVSDDPEKLPARVVGIVQALVRPLLQRRSLREALGASEAIAQEAVAAIRVAPGLAALGVEVQALAVHGIRPTPELGRALEASAREGLQREADAAVAARREAAVAQDRAIREAELEARRSTEARERELSEAQQSFRLAQSREELESRLAEAQRQSEASRESEALSQAAQLALAAEKDEAERAALALSQAAALLRSAKEAEAEAEREALALAARLKREAEEATAEALQEGAELAARLERERIEAMADAERELLEQRSAQAQQAEAAQAAQAAEALALAAHIAREQERAQLVEAQAANAKVQADAAAHTLAASLAPLAQLDPRALQALTASHGDARVVMAHAFQELAANAQKVGTLNLSPDLLEALLKPSRVA